MKSLLSDDEARELLPYMRLCPQFANSKKRDPQTGKFGKACRAGKLCKKMHATSYDAAVQQDTVAAQVYNVPFLSLYRSSSSLDVEVQMYIRPPMQQANRPRCFRIPPFHHLAFITLCLLIFTFSHPGQVRLPEVPVRLRCYYFCISAARIRPWSLSTIRFSMTAPMCLPWRRLSSARTSLAAPSSS
jgi:hypothetical protein